MRTLVDIPDEDVKWLDRHAGAQGKSRAAIVREAVSAYRAERMTDGIDAAFGIWKGKSDIVDAVDWQRRERASWTRPWDEDYEDVRAEFPEMFDEEDDRQHEAYKKLQTRGR